MSRPAAPSVSLCRQGALDGHLYELQYVDGGQHGVDFLFRAAGRRCHHADRAHHDAKQGVQYDARAGHRGQHRVQRGQLIAVMAQLAHLVQAHAAQQRAGAQDGGQRGGRHPEQRFRREVHVVLDHQEYDDHYDDHDQREQPEEQSLVGAREAHALRHVHTAQLRVILFLGHRRRFVVMVFPFRGFYLIYAHVLAHHERHPGGY